MPGPLHVTPTPGRMPRMPSGGGFAFGPFQLDRRAKQLARDGQPVPLPGRQFELLLALVHQAGTCIPKEELIQAAWQDVTVTDSSLFQAISRLRATLDPDDPNRYISRTSRRGYCFVAPVTRVDVARPTVDVFGLLAPDRAWGDGLAALESLEHPQLLRARVILDGLTATHPDEPRFHVGLALACALLYDATRTDLHPDTETLQRAEAAAHESCRLAPEVAECWATLGLVLERTGDRVNAVAALRRAARLEPDNWLHHCRLAAASWGEDRLRAVRQTLALNPGFAIAHLLSAMVRVAREAPDLAERDVDAGIAAMTAESRAPARFSAVALHYLKGLLCLARGAIDDAHAAFERELALESRGHFYARECCANTCYAKGAAHLRAGNHTAARAAFEDALTRVPGHPMAQAGLEILGNVDRRGVEHAFSSVSMAFERAMAHAALRVQAGDVIGAVSIMVAALTDAPPGNAGWLIPLEPLLRVQEHRDAWTPVLAMLHQRAR